MANWRDEMEHLGLDLCDGGRSLLDLRFANDTLIFGTDLTLTLLLYAMVRQPI